MAKFLGEIDIAVGAGGQTTVSVSGIMGPSCKTMTADIEAAFGGVEKDTVTREFTQTPEATVKAVAKQ